MATQHDDTSGGFEDFSLPPADVKVLSRYTGAGAYVTVTITLALVPFVQAVAAALGSKLADGIDGSARGAVRRLLSQVRRQPGVPTPPPGTEPLEFSVRVSVALVDEDSGLRVSLPDSLPAEAVVQLLKMAQAGAQQIRGTVLWLPEGARDGHWFVESEGRLVWEWDSVSSRWSPAG